MSLHIVIKRIVPNSQLFYVGRLRSGVRNLERRVNTAPTRSSTHVGFTRNIAQHMPRFLKDAEFQTVSSTSVQCNRGFSVCKCSPSRGGTTS